MPISILLLRVNVQVHSHGDVLNEDFFLLFLLFQELISKKELKIETKIQQEVIRIFINKIQDQIEFNQSETLIALLAKAKILYHLHG